MNRILPFILLIIVATTAFVPCCPLDNCQEEILNSKQGNSDQESEGNCSPFNACTSCSGFTVAIKNITFQEAVQVYPEYYNSNVALISSIHSNSFWQPPRTI